MDKGEKGMMLVFICHPWRGNPEHAENTKKIVRHVALECKVTPISTGVHYNSMFDDSVETERKIGINSGLEVLFRCDEIWVFNIHGISEGMEIELAYARTKNIQIRHFVKYPWETKHD
jgi:hypothetical protein